MVVTQPWLRERRLSLGAAAQGQYYLSGVHFAAPPPSAPHFPRPIRSEPPSSPPLQRAHRALYAPLRYRQRRRDRRQWHCGHHPHAGHRRSHRRRRHSLLRPRRRRFFVDFAAFSIWPRLPHIWRGPEYGRWTAWAAPGRRRAALARPGGGWGACQRPWGRQRRLSWAAARLRPCFS
jgi:hypothetical protein